MALCSYDWLCTNPLCSDIHLEDRCIDGWSSAGHRGDTPGWNFSLNGEPGNVRVLLLEVRCTLETLLQDSTSRSLPGDVQHKVAATIQAIDVARESAGNDWGLIEPVIEQMLSMAKIICKKLRIALSHPRPMQLCEQLQLLYTCHFEGKQTSSLPRLLTVLIVHGHVALKNGQTKGQEGAILSVMAWHTVTALQEYQVNFEKLLVVLQLAFLHDNANSGLSLTDLGIVASSRRRRDGCCIPVDEAVRGQGADWPHFSYRGMNRRHPQAYMGFARDLETLSVSAREGLRKRHAGIGVTDGHLFSNKRLRHLDRPAMFQHQGLVDVLSSTPLPTA